MSRRRCLHPRCGAPSIFFGIACDWDWEILDEPTRTLISDRFHGRDTRAARDPLLTRRRGGPARTVGEALFVMRDRLHLAGATRANEEPWR